MKPNGIAGSISLNLLGDDGIVYHKALDVFMNDAIDMEIMLSIYDDKIVIKSDKTIEYRFESYKSINELIEKVNLDSSNEYSPIHMINNVQNKYILSFPTKSMSSVNTRDHKIIGTSGLYDNKNEVYHCLKETLNIVIGESIDIVLPFNCYIDDTYIFDDQNKQLEDSLNNEFLPDNKKISLNFYSLFLEFCKMQSIYGIITKTILGYKPFMKDIGYYMSYNGYVYSIIDEDNSKYRALISECVGDLYYDCGAIMENSYIAYAIACASTPHDINVENVSLGEKISIKTTIDKDTAKKFKEFGLVFTRYSYLTNQVHTCNTLNKSTGVLAYDYVVFSLAYLYKILYPVLNNRIGEIITDESNESLNSDIDRVLKEFDTNSLAIYSEYILNTKQNGDTYIICSSYFPGAITPFNMIIELM